MGEGQKARDGEDVAHGGRGGARDFLDGVGGPSTRAPPRCVGDSADGRSEAADPHI